MALDRDLLYPLSEFYEQCGLRLPEVVSIEGRQVPEPYRTLLVHDRDMTPTLEGAYGREMQLRVLRFSHRANIFSREILLAPEGRAAPVLFGAINIYLEHFSPPARDMVVANLLPFGTILKAQQVEHFSRPDAYLLVTADATLKAAFGLTGDARLYGRRNALWTTGRRKLAQVLEILAPASDDLLL